jgi:hypothetical protein
VLFVPSLRALCVKPFLAKTDNTEITKSTEGTESIESLSTGYTCGSPCEE